MLFFIRGDVSTDSILVNFTERLFFCCIGCNGCNIFASVRPKVKSKERHKARGVSLPPHLEKAALERAFKSDISFSKYVQRLIKIDLERNLIAGIKTEVA